VPLKDFTTEHPIEISPSEIESTRFGLEFGRCIVPASSTTGPAEVARAIETHNADITVLRYPAERVTWYQLLTRQLGDHVLLHADTLVYWQLRVGKGHGPDPVDGISTSDAVDTAMIDDLTTRIFANYSNHYSANPLLSLEAVEAGYREWATKTPLNDVVVLFKNESPIGMATTASTPDHIEILLAGIIPEQRRGGLYPHLLLEVESRAYEESLGSVAISTQAYNIAVQRAWAQYGFLPLAAFNTIHVIRSDLWAAQA
jgi:hypothetical protein